MIPGAAVFLRAVPNENGASPAARPIFIKQTGRLSGSGLVMRVGVLRGVVDARLVGMLMGMQAVAVGNVGVVGVVGRLVVVARLIMLGGFVMVLGGLFVVMGGLAVMFSAFVSCRHIHVLREVITLSDRPAMSVL